MAQRLIRSLPTFSRARKCHADPLPIAMNPKRAALWFLIVSVVLSALSGIIAIVSGTFGDLQARIILTTLTISAASLCALACGALWESGRGKTLPAAGILLAVVTAAVFIFGIWSKISNEEFWKFAASLGLIAVASAHACLLSLATLARRFAWSRVAAFVLVYLLALEFIYVIYATPKGDTFVRIIGVTSIMVAALTILTPVFHRLSGGDLDAVGVGAATRGQTLHPTTTCPQCGATLPSSPAEIKCPGCGCVFEIRIHHPSPFIEEQAGS